MVKSAQIIAMANHKGGVGKTTSVVNLGAGLADLGSSVLLVDLDPQANLTQSLGVIDPAQHVYGSLRGQYPLQPIPIDGGGVDLIASTLDLGGAELELASEPGREYILRDILQPQLARYDYILIDSPPSLGLLTLNALCSAQLLLIPSQAEYLALHGLTKLKEVAEKIRNRANRELRLAGIFLTQYDQRKTLHRQVYDSLQHHYPELLLETKIRDNVALAEAPTHGKTIFSYKPTSLGAQDYRQLASEVLTRTTTNTK